MIICNAPEVVEATKNLCDHVEEACETCSAACEMDDAVPHLCDEGKALYELEQKAIARTSVQVSLVKQDDGGWIANFTDRPGGGFGKTASEALHNLANVVEECLSREG